MRGRTRIVGSIIPGILNRGIVGHGNARITGFGNHLIVQDRHSGERTGSLAFDECHGRCLRFFTGQFKKNRMHASCFNLLLAQQDIPRGHALFE